MRKRAGAVVACVAIVAAFCFGSAARADEDDNPDPGQSAPGDVDGDGTLDTAEDGDGDGTPDGNEDTDGDGVSDAEEMESYTDVDPDAADADGDGTPDSQEDGDIDNDGVPDAGEEDPPTDPFDADGDGKIEEDEKALRAEFADFFDDIPNLPDDAALEARAPNAEMTPSISVEDFRKGVRLAKKVVLGKMAKKIQNKADQKMMTFSFIVMGVSVLGFGLLLMPLFLRTKYPGQGGTLFKYSALAAVTFFVTVNLFGGVLFGLRTVQSELSNSTNPSIAIAAGTFDTLDHNAEEFVVTGKELFLPTIEQMRNNPEEQPAVLLIENGMRVVDQARVFMSIARMFKKVDVLFGMLPILLTIVTLILFVLAIKPTLVEIVKLPAAAASGRGGVGRDVVKTSLGRVMGELLATLGTIVVLVILTMLSAFVLGRIVEPAIGALLNYFSLAVTYLQFAEGASSGLVFVTLFAVILFLVFNLATLIMSMAFFLGKTQKILQARFNDGTPIGTHARFFKWGVPSVLVVQLFPLGFIFAARMGLQYLNPEALGSAEEVSWPKIMLAGPIALVVGYVVLFWAVRGVKAIKFLQSYKVKPTLPKAAP